MSRAPKFSGSFWTTYRFPHRLTAGGGVRHTDEVFVNAANTIVTPGYNLLDLIFQYDFSSKLSLRVNVNNATDEVYIRNINNNGARYNPGNPRSAMLTLIANY